jgi:hypothetical protein
MILKTTSICVLHNFITISYHIRIHKIYLSLGGCPNIFCSLVLEHLYSIIIMMSWEIMIYWEII